MDGTFERNLDRATQSLFCVTLLRGRADSDTLATEWLKEIVVAIKVGLSAIRISQNKVGWQKMYGRTWWDLFLVDAVRDWFINYRIHRQ